MKRLFPVLLLLAACTGGAIDPTTTTTTLATYDEDFASRQAEIETDNMVVDLEDGVYLGFLQWVASDGLTEGREVHLDLAVWFRGNAAVTAATEDGEEAAPAGYYIRNLDLSELVLPVSDEVEVWSYWYHYDEHGLEPREMTFEQLAEVWADTPADVRSNLRNSPWWITIVNGQVAAINEQYIP